jgi:hypothetical protein
MHPSILVNDRGLSDTSAMNIEPAHLHVLLNHLPLTGLAVAVVVLLAALLLRNRPAVVWGLVLAGLLSGSAWLVIESGESSYVRVRELADEDGKAQLKQHMLIAERWSNLYYVTAAACVAGLLTAWKWPRGLYGLAVLVAVLAAASLVAGVAIAEAGGKIRHPEFRTGPPSVGNHGDEEHPHTH